MVCRCVASSGAGVRSTKDAVHARCHLLQNTLLVYGMVCITGWRFSRSENRGDMSAAMSAAEGARENNLANSQKDKVTANLGGKRAEQMVMVSAQAAPRSIPRADPSTKEVSNVSIYPKAHGGQGSYFLDLRQSSAACQLRGCGRS